jgi:hypothetical protein
LLKCFNYTTNRKLQLATFDEDAKATLIGVTREGILGDTGELVSPGCVDYGFEIF